MTIQEILSKISRATGTANSTTSSYTIAQKTLDTNLALNNYFILANSASGNWRPVDDTNNTGYTILRGDMTSGQQDYPFVVDQDGNQILDIYKIRVKNPNGIDWITLDQINQDVMTDDDLQTVTSGTPDRYRLTDNGIFLIQKPNYSSVSGIEIWINRSPIYFTAQDVATGTKVAGIPWVHQEYLFLRPSYFFCMEKVLPQASGYKLELYGQDGKSGMEGAIKKYYRDRNKNFSPVITGESVNSI